MAKILQKAVGSFIDHMERNKIPACFDKHEYKAWLKHELESPTKPIRGFVCRDCTSSYQKEMRIQGRCFNPIIPLQKIVD